MTVPPDPRDLTGFVESKATTDIQKPSCMNSIPLWCSSSWKAILAELVSTTFLLLFGCMSCLPIDGFQEQPPLYAPFGFGLTVLFNIQTFGHISGAHMNPAVTLAAVILGKTSVPLGIAYAIAQCIGAIFGYGILVGLSPVDVVPEGVCVTLPHAAHDVIQSLGVEIVLTAMLSFICCAGWDPVNELKQESSPIKFGLAIVGLSISGGPLTGASMNPARSLGPSLWTNIWTEHWVYWAGPIVGSAIAAVSYKYIWLNEKETRTNVDSIDK